MPTFCKHTRVYFEMMLSKISFLLLLTTCFVLQTTAKSIISEPGCSRIDYEENILRKLVRMEHAMEILENKLKDWEAVMKTRLAKLDEAGNKAEARLTATQGEITETTEKYIREKTDEIEKLQNKLRAQLEAIEKKTQSHEVAFYAQLTSDVANMGYYQTIVFDLVTTNHGNGYNAASGIFTAPTPGTYVISWTTTNQVHSHMQTELVVNNVIKGKTWSDAADHNDVAVASNTVTLTLDAEDVAWIRSNKVHSGAVMGSQMSTFSGWLLF